MNPVSGADYYRREFADDMGMAGEMGLASYTFAPKLKTPHE
jgi:hypothetical protein